MDSVTWVVDPVTQAELAVPPYATARSAIDRAGRPRDGALRSIRFFPDYTVVWPLWEAGLDEDLSPETLILSENLWNDIRTWNEEWANDFRHDTGWPTALRRDAWFNTGDALIERLQEELWEIAVVTPRFRVYRAV